MKKLLRYFSVLPALLMLLLIFRFSAQDGDTSGSLSYRLSHAIMQGVDRVFSLDFTEAELLSHTDSIQLFVRKAAHITEYFLLTCSIFLPLHVWILEEKNQKSLFYKILLLTFVLSVVCAALDEFHQSFVPGRCGTPVDVLVDSVGIIIGCILLAFCHHRIKNKRSK